MASYSLRRKAASAFKKRGKSAKSSKIGGKRYKKGFRTNKRGRKGRFSRKFQMGGALMDMPDNMPQYYVRDLKKLPIGCNKGDATCSYKVKITKMGANIKIECTFKDSVDARTALDITRLGMKTNMLTFKGLLSGVLFKIFGTGNIKEFLANLDVSETGGYTFEVDTTANTTKATVISDKTPFDFTGKEGSGTAALQYFDELITNGGLTVDPDAPAAPDLAAAPADAPAAAGDA